MAGDPLGEATAIGRLVEALPTAPQAGFPPSAGLLSMPLAQAGTIVDARIIL